MRVDIDFLDLVSLSVAALDRAKFYYKAYKECSNAESKIEFRKSMLEWLKRYRKLAKIIDDIPGF